MSQKNGQFNLDFEETVLLRSRIGILKKVILRMGELARKVFDRNYNSLSETSKDDLREISRLSRERHDE